MEITKITTGDIAITENRHVILGTTGVKGPYNGTMEGSRQGWQR